MNDYLSELTRKYKDCPDEANADAYDLQDACNLQAIALTFVAMARAANFNYKNPSVVVTLDKMNSLCNMQGKFYLDEQTDILMDAFKVCREASVKRKEMRNANG